MSLNPIPDVDEVASVLSSPPFVVVPGVINIRALGGTAASKEIKPLHVFRSGELARINEDGKDKLHELGVTTVFDLRSDSEVARFQSATPDLPGIDVVRVPALSEDAWKVDVAEVLVQITLRLLMGKDRTGMFAALFYMLLGINDNEIAQDYALSVIGLSPVAGLLETRFKSVPVYRDNWEAFTKMAGAKAETMLAVLLMIREKFGGVEAYLKSHAGLTDEDLFRIRGNMLVQEAA
ncbi:hypothetical protein H0H93_015513 [Arthromyces matolae]|nr:hypothetical protein H0H93_015513 [Arthromyces matolae]